MSLNIVFLLFRYYLPLKKGLVLQLNKLEFLLHKNTLCQVYLNLAHCFQRRRLLHFVNEFSLFLYDLPQENGELLHLCKLEFSSPNNTFCHVWLKSAPLFCRKIFLNVVNIFQLFRYHLFLEKGVSFHLNKFECHLPNDAVCQVWQKFSVWFCRERF